MTTDHPFAQYVRIVGKGPNLSRSLTADEMYAATRMILAGEVEPVQLGAFLVVLRVRSEVPEEGLGFVRAVRDALHPPADVPPADLDWPAYGGKKRQLPWYLLAALLLAQNGVRIAMQGADGHTPGRIHARQALDRLGIPIAASLAEAGQHIRSRNFAYLPLGAFMPRLQEIIELKPILGVRSPVNTFARIINPLQAPCALQTVVHSAYRDLHREVARLLGQPHMTVFKGEGGEAERRPHKPVLVQSLHEGALSEEEWPALLAPGAAPDDPGMDLGRLSAVWRGEDGDAYANAAVIGTAAIALNLLGRAATSGEAIAMAETMWGERNKEKLAA